MLYSGYWFLPDNKVDRLCCFCFVTKSCVTLWDPTDCSQQALSSVGFPRQGSWGGLYVCACMYVHRHMCVSAPFSTALSPPSPPPRSSGSAELSSRLSGSFPIALHSTLTVLPLRLQEVKWRAHLLCNRFRGREGEASCTWPVSPS